MGRVVRAALTETRNAFADMPPTTAGLPALAGRLEEVRSANVERHVALLRAAAAAGARLAGLGELFTGPYFPLTREPLWRGLAEDAGDGPTVTRLRGVCRELGLVVVAPIYERDGERRFNTAVVIDERGEVLGRHRKVHIPEGRNEQNAFCERFYYEPSDGAPSPGPANVSDDPYFPVLETSVGRLGVATCYDRHFPGSIWSLARQGAEVVLSPAVTFGAQSRRMWRQEFAVDALRHRVYVGGSNRRGAEPPWNQPYFGDSHFVGPDGPLANPSTHPELVLADLDLDRLAAPGGSGWDLRRDERPEAYSLPRP